MQNKEFNLATLCRKYPGADPLVLKDYRPADKFIFVNTRDRDLIPIQIPLPKCPDLNKVEGFGLPADKQMWQPPQMPIRLKELQSRFETLDEAWVYIEENSDIYKHEIEFMEKAWDRRLNGHWLFINGKPTYIDGWHYFYCGWWHIDIGLPDFRDRDRRWFIAARYFLKETKTFDKFDKDGWAIPNDDESYNKVDTGHRLLYGFNYPKHRREGATSRAECINYEIISRTENASGGIQSMNETQAKKAFTKFLIAPWKKLPFFFKPNYEGSTSPKSELSMEPPAVRLSSKGSLMSSSIGLGSKIDSAPADKSAYDGDKLYFHHDDEVGKLKPPSNCWDRHQVVKECLVTGAKIIGFTIKTSTVGEMEKGGGRIFQHQCSLSHYHQRDENGQTISGLANLFFPAHDGLEGFIDKFGYSIIDKPTPEQAKFINRTKGAKQYLLARRKGFIDKEDYESLSEEIRLYPMSWRECFRTRTKQSGFDLRKLEERIETLRFERDAPMRTGNFKWVDNIRDGTVEWVDSPGGKFNVSLLLDIEHANKKVWDEYEESWEPLNTEFGVAGGDPFKFNKTEHNRRSDAGGAVVQKGKYNVQKGQLVKKRRAVCTYSNRTKDKWVYAEDMIMMCCYYGVHMFPEINVPLLWDYFEQRRYSKFLLHRIDPGTWKQKITPGANTGEAIKQDIFTEYLSWIANEIDEEVHVEILEQCRDIAGIEDMTNFDLFTAFGFALLGTQTIYDEVAKLTSQESDISTYFKKKKYKNPRRG